MDLPSLAAAALPLAAVLILHFTAGPLARLRSDLVGHEIVVEEDWFEEQRGETARLRQGEARPDVDQLSHWNGQSVSPTQGGTESAAQFSASAWAAASAVPFQRGNPDVSP